MVDKLQLTDPILATELTLQSLDEWLEVIFTKITDWSSIQYEEGDTAATATGTAMMFKVGTTLRVPSTTYKLPVDTEFSDGTEIVDGERRPRCPQVAAFAMGYNEDDEVWNRSRHGTVHNLHTGDYEPNTGVSLRLEGASGSVPVGDSDPLPISISTTKEITNYDNTTSAPDIYIGWAAIGSADSGSVWRIQKWDYTGTNYTIRWADAGSQTNIWNSRASLTYT